MEDTVTATIKTDLERLVELLDRWFADDAVWGIVAQHGERAAWGNDTDWLQAEQSDFDVVTVRGDTTLVERIAGYFFPIEANERLVSYFEELRSAYLPPYAPDEAEYVRETASFVRRSVAGFWPLLLHGMEPPGFRVPGENLGRFVETLRRYFDRKEAAGHPFAVAHPQFKILLWAAHTWTVETTRITINTASAFCKNGVDGALEIELGQVAGDVRGFVKTIYPFMCPAVDELLWIIQDIWPAAQVNGIATWPGGETAVSPLPDMIDEAGETAVDVFLAEGVPALAKQYGKHKKVIVRWRRIIKTYDDYITNEERADKLDIPLATLYSDLKDMRKLKLLNSE